MEKTLLTWAWVYVKIAEIKNKYPYKTFYGIPRGGQIVAGLTGKAVDNPNDADILIDDIVDSGKTAERWAIMYEKDVITLCQRKDFDTWVEFPWEQQDTEKDDEDIVIRMIERIGEDVKREGLIETPKRVVKSWNQLFIGYQQDPKDFVKTFKKHNYDQMIVLKDCELYSTCEHHILPFIGKVHIGYIPGDKVIGISKLARIAECFSRRLQIQERIGEQITQFIMEELKATGAICVIEAKHLCMMMRGIEKQNSIMITSSIKGDFRKQDTRMEFLNLIGR